MKLLVIYVVVSFRDQLRQDKIITYRLLLATQVRPFGPHTCAAKYPDSAPGLVTWPALHSSGLPHCIGQQVPGI